MFELINLILKGIAEFIVLTLKFFERLFKTDIVLTLFVISAFVVGSIFNVVGMYWILLFILVIEFGYSAYKGERIDIVEDHMILIQKIKDFAGQKTNRTQTLGNNNYYVEQPPVNNYQPPIQNPQIPQPPVVNNYQPPVEPPIHNIQMPQPPVMQQPIQIQKSGFKINKKASNWTSKGREENLIADLEDLLRDRIKFQDVAVTAVVNGLKRASVSNNKNTKLNYLLTGPTGTGKTEMVKLTAEGLKRPFTRYDMGNYKTKDQLWQLLGSPQGYVGGEGKLTQFVRNNPTACILFDEIEKGCEEIYDFMLPMLDEGIVKDNRTDQTVDFSRTIIFFTTNQVTNAPPEAKEDPEIIRNLIESKKFLRPELIARIKNLVPFFEFEEDHIAEIVGEQLEKYAKNLLDPRNEGIPIDCDYDVVEFISSKVDKKFGARNIHQQIERYLGNSITDTLFQKSGKTVRKANIFLKDMSVKVEVE